MDLIGNETWFRSDSQKHDKIFQGSPSPWNKHTSAGRNWRKIRERRRCYIEVSTSLTAALASAESRPAVRNTAVHFERPVCRPATITSDSLGDADVGTIGRARPWVEGVGAIDVATTSLEGSAKALREGYLRLVSRSKTNRMVESSRTWRASCSNGAADEVAEKTRARKTEASCMSAES